MPNTVRFPALPIILLFLTTLLLHFLPVITARNATTDPGQFREDFTLVPCQGLTWFFRGENLSKGWKRDPKPVLIHPNSPSLQNIPQLFPQTDDARRNTPLQRRTARTDIQLSKPKNALLRAQMQIMQIGLQTLGFRER